MGRAFGAQDMVFRTPSDGAKRFSETFRAPIARRRKPVSARFAFGGFAAGPVSSLHFHTTLTTSPNRQMDSTTFTNVSTAGGGIPEAKEVNTLGGTSGVTITRLALFF